MSEVYETQQFCKLFIRGLSFETTEDGLNSYFEKWGEVTHCKVLINPDTGKSRGFGFIHYRRAHMVDDAQAARPHEIDGRKVKTRRVVPREDAAKPEALASVNKLYVTGIKEDIDEEDLREYFGLYGNIVSINVVTDKNTGNKRGFAFVEFDDYDPVDKIAMQHHYLKGRKLEVRKALSPDERYIIILKKEMGGFGRGRGAWRSAYNLHRGDYVGGGYTAGYGGRYGGGYGGDYTAGYGGHYGGGYGGDYTAGYGGHYGGGYGSRGGAGWGGNFGPSCGRGPIRGNTGYAQRSQRRGQGSGGYGRN